MKSTAVPNKVVVATSPFLVTQESQKKAKRRERDESGMAVLCALKKLMKFTNLRFFGKAPRICVPGI